jgi:hypothetical protein
LNESTCIIRSRGTACINTTKIKTFLGVEMVERFYSLWLLGLILDRENGGLNPPRGSNEAKWTRNFNFCRGQASRNGAEQKCKRKNGAERKHKRKNGAEWKRRRKSLIPLFNTSTSADDGDFCRRLTLVDSNYLSHGLLGFSKEIYCVCICITV